MFAQKAALLGPGSLAAGHGPGGCVLHQPLGERRGNVAPRSGWGGRKPERSLPDADKGKRLRARAPGARALLGARAPGAGLLLLPGLWVSEAVTYTRRRGSSCSRLPAPRPRRWEDLQAPQLPGEARAALPARTQGLFLAPSQALPIPELTDLRGKGSTSFPSSLPCLSCSITMQQRWHQPPPSSPGWAGALQALSKCCLRTSAASSPHRLLAAAAASQRAACSVHLSPPPRARTKLPPALPGSFAGP